MVTEAIAAQPRNPLPAVIVDRKPPDLNADLVAEGAGVLSIRSVYDIMGADQARVASGALSSIASVSNPSNAAYAQRLVRFMRIEKLVSQPDDDDIADPDNSAFGPTGQMREIVAYAPVEPDGSVRMKVPGNIAFQLTLLDANGRRIGSHGSWLSVRPGEVLECNGCHVRSAHDAAVAWPQGLVQCLLYGRDRHRRRIPRHREHDFARGGRHHGGGAFARWLLVHRSDHHDRTLRRVVDHAERRRGVQRDLAARRVAGRIFSFSHNQLVTARPTNPFCYPDVDGNLPHHDPLRHHRHPRRTHSSAVVRAAPGRRRR